MPPAASAEAVWKVPDFGKVDTVPPPKRANSDGGNGPRPASIEPAKTEVAEPEVPLRVPFGRGPKDRAFVRESQEKAPPASRPGKPFHKGHRGKPFGKEPHGKRGRR
jgi:hypothetical protein